MVPLGELLTPISRPESVQPKRAYRVLGAHWYAGGLYVKQEASGAEIRAAKVYKVEEGDFVYNRLFAWKGSFAIATKENHGCYVSNEFPCFRVAAENLDPQFLRFYFRRQGSWFDALALSTGGTPTSRNRLKESAFLAMRIPLPPFAEQRRIVERIETIADKIEAARRLRSAADAERNVLFAHAAAACLTTGDWPMIPLAALLTEESRNGLGTRPSDQPPGVPILRISAGTSRPDAVVDEDDFKFLEVSRNELENYKLRHGDILACRFNGNLRYVGRFSFYAHERGEDRVYPDKLIRFRVDRTRVLPEFVCLAMNSPSGRRTIEAFCATTAGNIGISATQLKTVCVPVPGLNDQKRIVRHFASLDGKLASARTEAIAASTGLDATLPSLLNHVFVGDI